MTGGTRHPLALLASCGLLFLVVAPPGVPGADLSRLFAVLPLEWLLLVAALILVPLEGRARDLLAALVAVGLVTVFLLKLGDVAMLTALNRPFNPVVDMLLVVAGLNVLTGSIGVLATGAVVLAVAALAVALLVAVFFSARCLLNLRLHGAARHGTRAAALVCGMLLVADAGQRQRLWQLPLDVPGTASATHFVTITWQRSATSLAELARFRIAAASDPNAGRTGLFDLVGGRDVLVVFIESYGRASFDNPLYSETHIATLRDAQARLDSAGYAMKSGWLTSPTAGGQSWLAHGTLASGLATTDQARYGAMLASGRQSLFHLAQDAGFRTAAVMPAITMAWPEGRTMGFDSILAAEDLDYAGQSFNWITMPDQYTLSAFEALLPPDPRPDFLQIALISSHAPWVPVPQMIDWADVGDGRVFDRWATSGDTPAEVWSDRDRVREQYRKAIDYALQAATSYAARREDLPLILILGDHQPARFVAGIDSRDVAAHLIGPPDLVSRVASWEWRDGLVPDGDTPVWPMAAFRDRFIAAFSSPDAHGESM